MKAMNDVRICAVLESYRALAAIRGITKVAGMMREAGYPMTYALVALASDARITPALLHSTGAR